MLCGGWEACLPTYDMNRPDFPHVSIEFISSGRGLLTLDGRDMELVAGTVFTYGPGHPHRIQALASAPPIKYFVDVSAAGGHEILESAGLSPGTACLVSSPHLVQRLYDDLIRHGQGISPRRERICAAAFEYLALEIAEQAVPMQTARSMAFDTFQRCRNLIEEQFLDLHSLAGIAETAHIDQAYLCRVFRKFAATSPYAYLLRLKMAHAVRRLHGSGLLVKEVAAELGFKNPYHFSRVFKRIYGVCPTQRPPRA